MKTLFTHGTVLCRNDQGVYYALKDAYLGVDGKYISYIGKEAPEDIEAYETRKDMSGKLLCPGLTNAHGHMAMTLLRGVGSGLDLQSWLFNAVFPVEEKLTPEVVRAGVRLAAMEMIKGGTTCAADMYFYPDASAPVLGETGLKVNICRSVDWSDGSAAPEAIFKLRESEELFKKWHGSFDGRVSIDYCLHSEYLTTENAVIGMAELASGYDCAVQVHISETKREHEECIQRHGLTPIAYFNKLGLLDTPTYCAHCVWVTDEDLDIMAAKGASIVHNPSSNMKLGSGYAPIAKALAKGINVSLGTDGCGSNNNLNMFEELHLASLIHKGYHNDPTMLTTDQLIDMATIGGAKAMRRLDTGILEPGKRADIIALDMDQPHLYPALDIPALLVYSAQAGDVCMTMVDGNVLYENGEFKTIDADEARFECEKALKILY